jgi:copper(I)-binding protein
VSRRRIATSLVALASAALLAGCGTGLEATTIKETGREDGASTDVGGLNGIAVRRLHVEPGLEEGHAAGATAYVTGGLVNNSTSADALVGASSDAASSVTLVVDGTPTTQVALPAQGTAPGTWAVALNGLTEELAPASYIRVTLEFQRAGRVTLDVPVEAGDTGLKDREEAQDPYEAE